MLRIYCPRHGSDVLLPESRIRALLNTAQGIVLDAECFDGERIVLRTGRGARSAHPTAGPAAPAVARAGGAPVG